MPPAADITRAQADRILELLAGVCAEVEHLVAEDRPWKKDVTERLVAIERDLGPVRTHYEALNKAREAAEAAAVNADAELDTEKKKKAATIEAVKNEWLSKLTPVKIGAIIAAIISALTAGGAVSGGMGRVQAAFDGFMGRGYDNTTVESVTDVPVSLVTPTTVAPSTTPDIKDQGEP